MKNNDVSTIALSDHEKAELFKYYLYDIFQSHPDIIIT